MGHENSMYGAKYGIWGAPIAGRSVFQKATDMADRVSGLFGKNYENMLKKEQANEIGLKNQETEQTMGDRINATNTKNQTDVTNYPLQQAAKTKQDEQMINQIVAHTGLLRSQAAEALALSKLHGANTGLIGSMQDQWFKDPRFGSSRGGAGGTYFNSATGEYTSTDTGAQATKDQKVLSGAANVKQYLSEVKDKLPKFQGGAQKASVLAQGVGNYFGANFKGPSDLASGQTAALEAAEGFINSFGLNATNENVAKAQQIFMPRWGESSKGYQQRLETQLDSFAKTATRAQDRLRQGNDVTPQGITQDQVMQIAKENGSTPEEVMEFFNSGGG